MPGSSRIKPSRGHGAILVATALLLLCTAAHALPAAMPAVALEARDGPVVTLARRQAIAALTTTQIAAFRPYSHYASAGYCPSANILAWDCGVNCDANPSFVPVAVGGDGDLTQLWYVGFDRTLDEVIVAHQGTNTSTFLPFLTDADIIRESLDSTLFPGVSSSVTAHSGFAGSQARSALSVLAAVRTALSKFGTKKVTVTGHSLGAAIAQLDALFLPLHLPGIAVRYVGYGAPRIGNQAFADYVDAQPISVTHINNKEDIVPILPGKFLGFHHSSGEIHIRDSGGWVACAGQDNPSDECVVGDVPSIFDGDESEHDGPYDGVMMNECS